VIILLDTWKGFWKVVKASWFGALIIAGEIILYNRAERNILYNMLTFIMILMAVIDIVSNSIKLAKDEIKRERKLEE
jgi:hypothetical protein